MKNNSDDQPADLLKKSLILTDSAWFSQGSNRLDWQVLLRFVPDG